MKRLEDLPPEFFDLVATKTFEELSVEEKQQIEVYLTKEEFNDFHAIVNDFSESDKALVVEAERFTAEKERSLLMRFLTYRLPVYQVAAGLLILLSIGFAVMSYNSSGKNEGKPELAVGQSEQHKDSLVVNHNSQKAGQSLAKDDYPKELIFNM